MGRNARRRAEKKTESKPIGPAKPEQGAAAAIGLVASNPAWAANRIAELERAMRVNYGLLGVMVERAGGTARIEESEWRAALGKRLSIDSTAGVTTLAIAPEEPAP